MGKKSLLQNVGTSIDDHPYIQFYVDIECIVFSPKEGKKCKAVVNKIGERMGYESHPTSIPNGTKMEKSDDELGMDIDDSSSYDLDNIDDDNQTSEYTSYGKPSKYDPQYSQDPRERYDHGGSQPGH